MAKPNEYVIERVTDLLQVPSEKWDALLTDLRIWMELRLEMRPLIDAGLLEMEPHLHWVDDDIEGLTEVNLTISRKASRAPAANTQETQG